MKSPALRALFGFLTDFGRALDALEEGPTDERTITSAPAAFASMLAHAGQEIDALERALYGTSTGGDGERAERNAWVPYAWYREACERRDDSRALLRACEAKCEALAHDRDELRERLSDLEDQLQSTYEAARECVGCMDLRATLERVESEHLEVVEQREEVRAQLARERQQHLVALDAARAQFQRGLTEVVRDLNDALPGESTWRATQARSQARDLLRAALDFGEEFDLSIEDRYVDSRIDSGEIPYGLVAAAYQYARAVHRLSEAGAGEQGTGEQEETPEQCPAPEGNRLSAHIRDARADKTRRTRDLRGTPEFQRFARGAQIPSPAPAILPREESAPGSADLASPEGPSPPPKEVQDG